MKHKEHYMTLGSIINCSEGSSEQWYNVVPVRDGEEPPEIDDTDESLARLAEWEVSYIRAHAAEDVYCVHTSECCVSDHAHELSSDNCYHGPYGIDP